VVGAPKIGFAEFESCGINLKCDAGFSALTTVSSMKRLLIFLTLVLASVTIQANGATRNLIQPKGLELKLVELKTKNDLQASFSGKAWVSGTFYGIWPGGVEALSSKAPAFVLLPDGRSKSALPHFVIKDPPYAHTYKVKSIDIENGEEALRLAVGDVEAQRLLDRKVSSIRVTGRFQIQSFVVGVECDAPWSKAKVELVEIPKKVAAHQKLTESC
jgi:hypothetical protein